MAETETPPVLTREALVPVRGSGGSMLDRWVEHDPEQAIKRMDVMVRMLEQLRLASIRATVPPDWIIHTSVDRDGVITKQVGYLQDSGAERAGKVWGIEVGSPAIEREDFPDGSYSYHMIAEAWSKVTGERLEYTEGSRWSGDTFFARQVKNEGDRIDPTDVRKSAYANLHGRAVRALSGLNGIPIDTLRQAGVDEKKLVYVNYDKGAKGGDSSGAAVGSSEITMGFGNAKGKKVSELEDKDLEWYIGANEKSLADPSKERFKKSTERTLVALKAEKDRRAQAKEHEAETGTKAPAAAGETATLSRGQKVATVHSNLSAAANGNGRQLGAMLRTFTKEQGKPEHGNVSDLSEAELDLLLAMTAEDFINLLARATAPKE